MTTLTLWDSNQKTHASMLKVSLQRQWFHEELKKNLFRKNIQKFIFSTGSGNKWKCLKKQISKTSIKA